MQSAARQFTAIARLTATQAVRTPVYALGLLALLLAAGTLPLLDYLALLEKRALVVDSLRGLSLGGGSLVAMLLAVTVVGQEYRGGAVALLRARPLATWVLLAGQLAGLALALLPLSACLGLGLLWGSRTAFDAYVTDRLAGTAWHCALALSVALAACLGRQRTGFGAALALVTPGVLTLALLGLCRLDATGHVGRGELLVDWRLAGPALLIWPGLVLSACVAGVAAVRLEPIAALCVAALVFALGLAGGAGWFWPDWQVFSTSTRVGGRALLGAYAYTGLWCAALAVLATRLPGVEEPA